jgi:hypothetical protein
MKKQKEVKRLPVVQSKSGAYSLYRVRGASNVAEERVFIVANNESEAAQYARTHLGVQVVTEVRLESDVVYF